jgi:hypothetical protein
MNVTNIVAVMDETAWNSGKRASTSANWVKKAKATANVTAKGATNGQDMRNMKKLTKAILAATMLATPAMAAGSGYDFHDTVFPEPDGDKGDWRIGNTSWVSSTWIIHGCEGPLVKDECPAKDTPIKGIVYSKEDLFDPRGYNLPEISIICEGMPGSPLKYSVSPTTLGFRAPWLPKTPSSRCRIA